MKIVIVCVCILNKTALLSQLCVLLISSQPVFANPAFEHVVVTGTRTARPLDQSPVKIDVIGREEISRLSKGTLRQVLDVMPGVVVRRSQKSGYTIQLNGFNSDHVLVLINGQPVVTPTGSSVDLDQISASNIRQIEIIRGAASVLYGSSAMGGVVNILLERPDADSLQIDYELARYPGTEVDNENWAHTVRLSGTKLLGNWKASLNVQQIDNPGFDYDSASVLQNGASVDKRFTNAALSRDFDAVSLTYKLQYLDEQKRRPMSAIPGRGSVLQYQSDVAQWQHDISMLGADDWQLNGRYMDHDEQSGNTNGLRATSITLAEIQGQKAVDVGRTEWVLGGLYHEDTLDQYRLDTGSVEVDDTSRQSTELYTQANWRGKGMQVLAGLRGQYDSDFGWHKALKTSLSIEQGNENVSLKWRAGVGTSYRVPNLKERYYIFDHSNLGYMVLGNQQLTPEEAVSLNGGLGLTYRSKHSDWQVGADVEFHYTDADNFIITQLDAKASAEKGLDISVYQNLDRAILRGADIGVNASNSFWKLSLNYSLLSTEDTAGQRLPERPRHLIKTSVTRYFDAFSGALQIYAVYEGDVAPAAEYSAVEEDSFVTLNAVYQLSLGRHWSARIGAENITDVQRDPGATLSGLFDARPISARRVYLGLSYDY